MCLRFVGVSSLQRSTLSHRCNRRITWQHDFWMLCPNVTPEMLRIDSADRVDKGALMRAGEKKGADYILK